MTARQLYRIHQGASVLGVGRQVRVVSWLYGVGIAPAAVAALNANLAATRTCDDVIDALPGLRLGVGGALVRLCACAAAPSANRALPIHPEWSTCQGGRVSHAAHRLQGASYDYSDPSGPRLSVS